MRRWAGLLFGAALLASGSAASAKPVTVGVSWSNLREDGWKPAEDAIRAAVAKAGANYLAADAQGSPARQTADIESLVANGANALVIVASDPRSLAPAVKRAAEKGVAVVACERPIESPDVLYVAFDDAEAGRMMGKALLAARPAGAYVFIRGPKGDAKSERTYAGVMESLKSAIAAGKVKTAGESFVDAWNPEGAMAAAQDILGKPGARADAIVSESDAMTDGVAAALSAQGLAGAVAVSGVGGDHAAINRVALGTQTISVWEDASDLGRTAAEAALALARGAKRSAIAGAKPFLDRAGKLDAVLVPPLAITRDNLNAVVGRGWMTKAQVCSGVKPGATSFCG